MASHWCEYCQHRFDREHFDLSQDLGPHLAGVEFGPYGHQLAIEAAARELASAVAPLLDRETVAPFLCAWEIDEPADGKEMHLRLAEAHGKLSGLLGDDA